MSPNENCQDQKSTLPSPPSTQYCLKGQTVDQVDGSPLLRKNNIDTSIHQEERKNCQHSNSFQLTTVPKDTRKWGNTFLERTSFPGPCPNRHLEYRKDPGDEVWASASEHANVRENCLVREDATRGGNFRARSCGSLPCYNL